MPWGVVLLPLLGGYYFLHVFYLTKYRAQSLQQYRLLFEPAIVGLVAALAARSLILLLFQVPGFQVSSLVTFWKTDLFPVPFSGTFALALIICILAAHSLNWPLSRGRASEKAYRDYADEMLNLIIRAQIGDDRGPFPLMITLKSRKVYIGMVNVAPTPDQRRRYLSIVPTASGYRAPDTLKLKITTLYQPVYDKLESGKLGEGVWNLKDFAVVVPLDEIESATTFVKSVKVEDFDLRDQEEEDSRRRSA